MAEPPPPWLRPPSVLWPELRRSRGGSEEGSGAPRGPQGGATNAGTAVVFRRLRRSRGGGGLAQAGKEHGRRGALHRWGRSRAARSLASVREEQRWRPKMETGSRGVVRMVDDDDTTRGHSFFNDSLRSHKNSGVRWYKEIRMYKLWPACKIFAP
jgi:hypothetical protein